MNHQGISLKGLEADLFDAVRLKQFELHYQPQVRMPNAEIVGMEALIRWAHPDRGLLHPADFMSVAEESGLIVPISEWALRTACVQNKAWQKDGLPHLTVAVNLSTLQFRQTGFVRLVSSILEETGLDPSFLDLEVTRDLVAGTPESLRTRFNDLRALGIVLSIDDFGAGHSAFGHFTNFPIDQLKIDRTFVHGLPDNRDAAAIARAIVSMGASLGIRVMALGVENCRQVEFLRSICCEYAQGYYYSKPLPADEFRVWAKYSMTNATEAEEETSGNYVMAS